MAYLTIAHGSLPWIALTLGFSFGIYGLIKKTAPLGALHGLTLETAILLPPATLYLLYAERSGTGAFGHSGLAADALMMGAGLVTTVPLLFFASAARRIPLSLLGVLQYIAPTLQFLLGVFVFREPFSPAQLTGFGLVWLALAVFAAEGYAATRAPGRAAAG